MEVHDYDVPFGDIRSALETAGLAAVCSHAGSAAADVEDMIREFGRFAAGVIAPTDRVGDREGVQFDPSTGDVHVPTAVRDAYRAYVDSGWGAATVSEHLGGGGLPYVARMVFEEILCSANMALSLNPMLTRGAIDLLGEWASADQRARFVPKLSTGEWNGTMNLTEPDAGSDVGALRTTASSSPDGSWHLRGTKIFITWGEHDVTDNIVHMVLARTEGAPAGTKGISLFIVPKFLADGTRNGVVCRGVEEKLGIHGSPTCVLEFDGAAGELVGELHSGMAAMFTMMNSSRLAIAVQGLGIGERSYRQALAYASERLQGSGSSSSGPVAIIEHPDVRRMLLDLRATTRAMRHVLYMAGVEMDVSRTHPDDARRREAADMVALVTPIAKAWCTDSGVRLASVALQVHGGAGYVEETGIAQRLRDSRIAPIYEGTNGIQAIDLVTRKVRRDDGRTLFALLERVDVGVDHADFGEAALPFQETWQKEMVEATSDWRRVTEWIIRGDTDVRDVLAGATSYLDLAAVVVAGWRLGVHATRAVAEGRDDAREAAVDAAFFAIEQTARSSQLASAAMAGAARLEL